MLTFLAPLALSLAQAGPATEPPKLTLEQASALRCSVAFGLVHKGQLEGDATMARYPVMAERGREFFVRTTAQLMDELGIDREAIMVLVTRESTALTTSSGRLDEVMPACLMMLESSGL